MELVVPFVLMVFNHGYASMAVVMPNMETCEAAKQAYLDERFPPDERGGFLNMYSTYKENIKCIQVGTPK